MPPAQSANQVRIFANRTKLAANASAAALPALVEHITFCSNITAADGNYIFGAVACPGLADLTNNGTLAPWPTANQILERFSAEVKAAEYGHGYFTLTRTPDTMNVFNPSYPFLLNLWEGPVLQVPPRIVNEPPRTTGNDSSRFINSEDTIQVDIFGCDPFTGPSGKPLDFNEAADRVVYTAMNYARSPLGNVLGFGTFDAVMRPKFVEDKILFTPTDSGHYSTQIPNCAFWPSCIPGTIDYHYHILLSWMATASGAYPPPLVASSCGSEMRYIVDLVCPVPVPRRAVRPAVLPVAPVSSSYWEGDILGTVQYPDGVKFMVAEFQATFGNQSVGMQLREMSLRYGWVLVWSYYANHDPRRIVDPYVAAKSTLNLTIPSAVATAFETQWTAANATWYSTGTNAAAATQWATLVNATLTPGINDALLWNIGVRDCEDYDNCIGVVDSTGDCACYKATE